jgi:glycine dehydrogenase subunit 1
MRELGTTIMQRSQYAAKRIGELPGVRSPALSAPFFKEFVVDFSGTGHTVADVNSALAMAGIHGLLDLSCHFAHLGQSALVCVTEVHTKQDIDRLVDALDAAITGERR